MKNLFFTAVAMMAAGLAFADATVVEGENIVGMTAISVADGQQNVALPIPYTALGGTDPISIANIVKTANLDVGDHLVAFDQESKKYIGWVLEESSGAKSWSPINNVTIGKNGLEYGSTQNASDASVAVGGAVWIFRSGTLATTIYVYGEYVEAPKTTIAGGSQSAPKWNFVANAGGALDGDAFAAKLASVDPKRGDQVYVITATGRIGPWNRNVKNTKWAKIGTTGLPSLAAGQAFWYVSQGGAGTIKW